MLSSIVAAGPREGTAPVVAGEAVQWVLANDGSCAWPEGTTLRLVGGPVALCPIIGVPPAAPGQTVCLELEVAADSSIKGPVEVFYSLVAPDCQPFGEIAHATIAPKSAAALPPAAPVMAVLSAPNDGLEGGIDALQGEMKTVEWTLANLGQVPWPEDTKIDLVYNTPGFAHLPAEIEVPKVAPGMTMHTAVSALMPEREGLWKAIWAVTSASFPDFGEILVAEFNVSDFPFMEWMLADAATADTISEISGQEEAAGVVAPTKKLPFSASIAMQQHLFLTRGEVDYPEGEEENNTFQSLGHVLGVPKGSPWILKLALTNDGEEAWPADAALTCCFGSGFGCGGVALNGQSVPAGETVIVQMELIAPEDAEARTAWVMTSGQACFGPAMFLHFAA